MGGGERGDVGAADGEAESVGTEEPVRTRACLGVFLGAMKRTMVQSRPETVMRPVMPVISS